MSSSRNLPRNRSRRKPLPCHSVSRDASATSRERWISSAVFAAVLAHGHPRLGRRSRSPPRRARHDWPDLLIKMTQRGFARRMRDSWPGRGSKRAVPAERPWVAVPSAPDRRCPAGAPPAFSREPQEASQQAWRTRPTTRPTGSRPTFAPPPTTPRSLVDLAARRFSGRIRIGLRLTQPRDELVLHAAELELGRAAVAFGGRELPAAESRLVPASETLVLRFAEPVPAGEASLELAWQGSLSAGLRGLYLAGPGLAATQFEAADAGGSSLASTSPASRLPGGWSSRRRAGRWCSPTAGRWPRRTAAPPGADHLRRDAAAPHATWWRWWWAAWRRSRRWRSRGVPVRTWATPEKLALTGFGQEVALEVAAAAGGLLRRPLRLRQARPGRPAGVRGRRHGERRAHHLP